TRRTTGRRSTESGGAVAGGQLLTAGRLPGTRSSPGSRSGWLRGVSERGVGDCVRLLTGRDGTAADQGSDAQKNGGRHNGLGSNVRRLPVGGAGQQLRSSRHHRRKKYELHRVLTPYRSLFLRKKSVSPYIARPLPTTSNGLLRTV